MPAFPLTAWALRHPWGTSAEAVLDALRSDTPRATATGPSHDLAGAVLDELEPACARACERWGTSRVAVILGATAADERPGDRGGLRSIRARTRIAGPAYHVGAVEVGGAKALASAARLLRASLADAVLVGRVDDEGGALLLVERHGHGVVTLRAASEATGPAQPEPSPHEPSVSHAVAAAWAAADRRPLDYVHAHAPASDPAGALEHRALRAVVGPVRCCSTRTPSLRASATASALDVVLAAASLARGHTPEAQPHELEHDRVLLHAFSSSGHHVALVLEARDR